jgi:hypothetical protein
MTPDPAATPGMFGRWMFYDRNGVPIKSTREWGRLREDESYYRIASDTIGETWVSTVWLGIDMGFRGGTPIIFETMVFDAPDSWEDAGCWRYATEEEARAGHEAVCAELRVLSLIEHEAEQ